ncbi:MAG: bifunctional phosphopantothenoylcysteine decarboxylase/phosphopantothenate--cysteine ligase CoaBC [bacterium]|nr:bifunctional phosphopantothenoylcysteine decarboxylase/phosphopantothenate--cysteine ligase CoaBC [bacterium]
MSLSGKKIIVGMTGGIACYKVPYLVRSLIKAGAEVRVIMTANATKFVTPMTLAATSRNPVYTDMWAERDEIATRHIELARWADLMVIAPATANFIGKTASGVSDDLLTTIVCATPAPVIIAPAMNPGMWHNPITQRNVRALVELGYQFIGPAEGEMAEKQFGIGRMLEPLEIFEQVKLFLESEAKRRSGSLAGRKVLVTAGPCREAIDPVRYISNRSSGKMGYAIAEAARDAGAEVTLISGPTHMSLPAGIRTISIETTKEMADAVKREFGSTDCLIMAAAPSDFTPTDAADQKIKRTGEKLQINLTPTTDILKEVASKRRSDQKVIGFALETENAEANGLKKLIEKKLDLIVVNNPRTEGAGFDHDTNQVMILSPEQAPEIWPIMPKFEVAARLIARVADLLAVGPSSAKTNQRG